VNPPLSLWSAESPPRLLASRHLRTGALRFPPFRSPSVLSAAHEQVSLRSTGRIYSFTRVHPNPRSGEAPFALGYVDLPGPVRIFGRLRGDDIHVGAECEVIPDAQFGYVFAVKA
jgi:uncharacterized OB-fold protein